MPADTNSFSIAAAKPPKRKKVSLLLDTSTRAANKFGGDVLSQFLWMRLDGLTINQIAAAVGCDEEIVTEAITAWQAQVEAKEGEQFQPRARNWRRWKNRRSMGLAA